MDTTVYTSYRDAIEHEIVGAIEANGTDVAVADEFDVDAIADEVLDTDGQGRWYVAVDDEEFWRAVEKHAKQYRAVVTGTNAITVFCDDEEDEEIDTVTVESSEDEASCIEALRLAGWKVEDNRDCDGGGWPVFSTLTTGKAIAEYIARKVPHAVAHRGDDEVAGPGAADSDYMCDWVVQAGQAKLVIGPSRHDGGVISWMLHPAPDDPYMSGEWRTSATRDARREIARIVAWLSEHGEEAAQHA